MRPKSALDRRTVLYLYVPGFQSQVFKHCPTWKWIPLTAIRTNRTNTCNLNFVGTLVLLWIRQQVKISSCPGYRNLSKINNLKWILQIFAYSADNLWKTLTNCGFRLQFADCVYSCGFHDSLSLLNTFCIVCLRIPQTVQDSANLLLIPQSCFF